MCRSRFNLLAFIAIAGTQIIGASSIFAAWPTAPNQQIVVTTGNNLQDIGSVSDNAGGVIIVYHANGVTTGRDILARRYNAGGDLAWSGGTRTVCDATGDQSNVRVVPTGDGGCFVMWTDRRSGDADVYVQKISVDGQIQFSPNGSPFLLAAGSQTLEHAISDSSGGFILAYKNVVLEARRYNSLGQNVWASAADVSAVSGDEIVDMVGDTAGGCTIGLERVGIGSEVVVVPVSPTGATEFDQLLSGNANGNQYGIRLARRPNGNVLAVWFDGAVSPSRLVANEFVHPLVFNPNHILPTGPGGVLAEFELTRSSFGDPILVYGFDAGGGNYDSKLARVTNQGLLNNDTFLIGTGTNQIPDNVAELPNGDIRVTYSDNTDQNDRKLMAARYLSDGQHVWSTAITPANQAFKSTGDAQLIQGSQNSLIVFSNQVLIPGGSTFALIRVRADSSIGGEITGPDLAFGQNSLTHLRKPAKVNLFGDLVVYNGGTVPSVATNLAVFVSPDPSLSSGAVFVFELSIPALQPNETLVLAPGQLPPKKPGKKSKVRKIKIPKTLKKVPVYILMGFDAQNTNTEIDENNNLFVIGPM